MHVSSVSRLRAQAMSLGQGLVARRPQADERALEDPEARRRLAENLEVLFRRKEIPPLDDARLREWIERAGTLGVDLLLDS